MKRCYLNRYERLKVTCCICRNASSIGQATWHAGRWICPGCAQRILNVSDDFPVVKGGQGHSHHSEDIGEFLLFAVFAAILISVAVLAALLMG